MRVLISAFAFSPYKGSEAAVGWNIATELARYHDVTVLTGAVRACENDWMRYVAEKGPIKGLTVEYVAPTPLMRWLERLHRLPCCWGFYYVAYNLWQRLAYRRARQLHAARPFDIVHQLNMIGYREPGYMWKLNAPLVWGPVGGAPNEPISYHSLFSWSGCIKVFLRTVCNEIQKRICWRARKAARHAAKVWAVTDADYRMIHDLWGVACEKMVETGTVLRPEGRVRRWDGKERLRVVWSGIHTSRKALPILIHALSKIENATERLAVDVLGEGPETGNWKRLAVKAGVADSLVWHGKLPHDKALEVMNAGHVFAFPSLKEGTPHVVLEALSLGLPVICHDACGMGTVVTASCGIKVPMRTPEESVDGFASAILDIISHKVNIDALSMGALDRVRTLTWGVKAKEISNCYNKLIKSAR